MLGKVKISQAILTFLNFLNFSRLVSINLKNSDFNPDQLRSSGLPDPNNLNSSRGLKIPISILASWYQLAISRNNKID